MAVRKLKSGKWAADVTVGVKWDGSRDRRVETYPTKGQARKAETRLLMEKERLRHSFATACVNEGMEVSKLSRIMGHADIKTTMRYYVRQKLGDLKAAVDAMDGARDKTDKSL